MIEKLYRMLNVYEINNGVKANTIFLGKLDFEEFSSETEAIYYMKLSMDRKQRFQGKDIVLVNRERYFKVGYVWGELNG